MRLPLLHRRALPRVGLSGLSAPAGKGAWKFSSRSFAAPAIELYQYEICPFCCKVKAFLDWQNVGYKTVEVTPLSKAEIKFSKDYRKVPIALIDKEQVNDSSNIMKTLGTKLPGEAGEILKTQLSDAETDKWLQWCDKELAVLLFPNITRSFGESWEAFRYISEVPTFGAMTKASNQVAGSVAMWLANGKLKKKYKITDERKQLLETVQVWVDAVGEGPFLKGDSISVSDIAVYGVISSIGGLATHAELLAASPGLNTWYNAVKQAIGSSARLESPGVVRKYGPTAV
eukprot:TRINITY_DN112078_c0_g1_i1.p1 TRINITY_DN112078_c0_g1~~TRINITY_DN112078_c0_g1_i1.p1  ORF type:complete len:287 (+),score=86.80 TRINITY_DN112078_c0_g1_i1:60-920(+)